jgi:hypothetical protein
VSDQPFNEVGTSAFGERIEAVHRGVEPLDDLTPDVGEKPTGRWQLR